MPWGPHVRTWHTFPGPRHTSCSVRSWLCARPTSLCQVWPDSGLAKMSTRRSLTGSKRTLSKSALDRGLEIIPVAEIAALGDNAGDHGAFLFACDQRIDRIDLVEGDALEYLA